MRQSIIHSIIIFLMALALPLMVACGHQEEPLTDITDATDVMEDADGQMQMVLRVSTADVASASGQIPVNERMHTLRIIALDESKTVERNIFIDFSNEPRTEHRIIIRLQNKEQKKIYLIANERSVEGLYNALEAKTEGAKGFEEWVNDFTFVPDYTQPLPMTSCYTVSIGEETYIEKTFHVVYAATKFDINFVNDRGRDVTLSSFTLSAPASSMYLMPHLHQDAGVYKADKDGKVVKDTPFVIDNKDGGMYWIDWLKIVAEESQANPDDQTLADKRGWILEYDIPSDAQQDAAHDLLQAVNNGQPLVLYKNKTTNISTFYVPESKKLAETSTFAQGLEQKYIMNLELTETDETGTKTKAFSTPLPNLRALFRNTHVKVNITLKDNILVVIVDLVPYTSKELNPIFGLDV